MIIRINVSKECLHYWLLGDNIDLPEGGFPMIPFCNIDRNKIAANCFMIAASKAQK